MLRALKNLWFRDPSESPVYINDIAVRIRAGMLLFIPLYMALTLWDAIWGTNWIVDGNSLMDTYETDWDGHIIYSAQVIRRTWDYTAQTWVLFYALFEMLAGMFVLTSRLSPTILLASLLAKRQPAVWKPLVPKRFAWGLGASFIVVCIVFFNPVPVAEFVNGIAGKALLPETESFMPYWIPLVLVWVCLGFMWLEAILGFCVGCKIHALMVKLGVLKEECEACNNIDWEEIARRNQAKQNEGRASEV
ncbi:MAG TPA: DUF4395 domain-containing protein [Chromatiales bacterium]|nr:DUF4395 domain-containing protein [Chromatiales bacterium]